MNETRKLKISVEEAKERLRSRLSAIVKSDGEDASTARKLRNQLLAEGLTPDEWQFALEIIERSGY